METTQREAQAANCSLCGELPDELIVNTGREQRFPAARYKLIPVGARDSSQGKFSQLHRCPDCGALFVWEAYPQMYGSGNDDEECLIRVSAEAPVGHQANSPSDDYDAGSTQRAAEVEAAHAQSAFRIMEKHFASAGAVMKHADMPKDWSQFCSFFYLNTIEFVERGMHTRLLMGLLPELVDFMRAFSGEHFTNNLYKLLTDFGPRYSWLGPLLPDSARRKIGDLEEMRSENEDEAERFRLGQMSY
jgi:hypothetical protein